MKPKALTVASIAALLATGTAAAMVNAQVLRNQELQRPPVITAVIAPAQVSPVTEVSVSGIPAAPESIQPASVASTSVVPPSVTTASYVAGSAGQVTVDAAGDRLAVVGIQPNAGWAAVSVRNLSEVSVEVHFESLTSATVFRASLVFGVISTSVTSGEGQPSAGPPSSPPAVAGTTASPSQTAPRVTSPPTVASNDGSADDHSSSNSSDHDGAEGDDSNSDDSLDD